MAQKKRKITFIIIVLLFLIYFLAAARPIPRESILAVDWISSLEDEILVNLPVDSAVSDDSASSGDADTFAPAWQGELMPFTLGSRFGFVDSSGNFALNKEKTRNISVSSNMWTEYDAEPQDVVINIVLNESRINIENAGGYPILIDDRIFILGSDQNSLSEIGGGGEVIWTYEFGAPVTAFDAAAGLVVTGSLDGIIEVFNSSGRRIYNFEPTGSRYSIILGCAISRNGMYIGIISGIDQQRFMLFERLSGEGDYRVIYHEYLDDGFRRPVHIWFVDDGQRVVFERMGGIGSYNIRTRRMVHIPLDGEITATDESGSGGYLFLVTSHADNLKKLVGIRFPSAGIFRLSSAAQESVFLESPFKSEDVFLKRSGSIFVIGGGTALISFVLGEK